MHGEKAGCCVRDRDKNEMIGMRRWKWDRRKMRL